MNSYIFFLSETKFLNSIGHTETAPAAVKTVKSCWDGHHITQTGLIIRAKMPPPPEPRFALTIGWGNTRRDIIFGQSLTARFLSKNISILRI